MLFQNTILHIVVLISEYISEPGYIFAEENT